MSDSEPHNRTERDAQIVVRPAIEVHLVPSLKPKAHRSEARFNPPGGIQSGVQTRGAQAQNRTHYAAVRKKAAAQSEIDEPRLQRGERTEMTTGRLHHGSDQPMRDSDGCVLDRHDISMGDIDVSFVKVQAVVIGELGFQDERVMNAVPEAGA